MDWRLFGSTFLAVFLAEMGDKTQLATLAFSGGGGRWTVFAAAALALVTTTAVAVLAGGIVGRHVSPLWTKRAAGALFVVLGVVFLLAKPDPPPSADDPAAAGPAEQSNSRG